MSYPKNDPYHRFYEEPERSFEQNKPSNKVEGADRGINLGAHFAEPRKLEARKKSGGPNIGEGYDFNRIPANWEEAKQHAVKMGFFSLILLLFSYQEELHEK